MSKGVEDGFRLLALRVRHTWDTHVLGVARPQGVDIQGMAGPRNTSWIPWPPLVMHPRVSRLHARNENEIWILAAGCQLKSRYEQNIGRISSHAFQQEKSTFHCLLCGSLSGPYGVGHPRGKKAAGCRLQAAGCRLQAARPAGGPTPKRP
jgi:hypothetical protein